MWIEVIREKQDELRRLADWASSVNLGRVRDHCRLAQAELESEVKRMTPKEAGKE